MLTGVELLLRWVEVGLHLILKLVTIAFGDIVVLQDGEPVVFSEEEAKAYLENDHFVINVYLKEGTDLERLGAVI